MLFQILLSLIIPLFCFLFFDWSLSFAFSFALNLFFLCFLWYLFLEVSQPEVYFDNSKERNNFIISKCTTLTRPFFPSFLFSNGHLQTIGTSLLRSVPNINYFREIFDLEDGGIVTLDWANSKPTTDSNTPIVIVLHGLTGGSQENYVRHLIQEISKCRWFAVALNFRGASDSFLKTPIAYNAAFTGDVRHVFQFICSSFPSAPLIAVGFSLGANVLVKYLGEEKEKTPLLCAVSISNPFDLIKSSKYMEAGINKRIYSKTLAENTKRFVRKHYEILKFTDKVKIDVLLQVQTLRAFDEVGTRRFFGYKSVDEYYYDASSSRYIQNVSIPLLCVNAKDDPIVPPESIPMSVPKINSNIFIVVTNKGGHVAFHPYHWNPFNLNKSWTDCLALEFIQSILSLDTKVEKKLK